MLDCLERDGHVSRRHSETDRRAVPVSLTQCASILTPVLGRLGEPARAVAR